MDDGALTEAMSCLMTNREARPPPTDDDHDHINDTDDRYGAWRVR